MSYPASLRYTKDHEWVDVSGSSAKVGITSYAIEQLGDVVFLELPKVGAAFKQGETFGTVESTKTVSDLYMPCAGKVVEVNQALVDAPEKIADDPHGASWLVKIEVTTPATDLLSAAQYEEYIKSGH